MNQENALHETLRVLRARQKANQDDLVVRPNNPSKEQLAEWFGMFHAYKEAADMLDLILNPEVSTRCSVCGSLPSEPCSRA